MEPVIAIPAILRHRPLLGGLVVPYNAGIRDGAYEFATADTARHAECLTEKLCMICGRGLAAIAAFVVYSAHVEISGDRVITSTGQAGMHPECVPYCVVACPFLARRGRRYADADPNIELWIESSAYTVREERDGTYVEIGTRLLNARPVAQHPALIRVRREAGGKGDAG